MRRGIVDIYRKQDTDIRILSDYYLDPAIEDEYLNDYYLDDVEDEYLEDDDDHDGLE